MLLNSIDCTNRDEKLYSRRLGRGGDQIVHDKKKWGEGLEYFLSSISNSCAGVSAIDEPLLIKTLPLHHDDERLYLRKQPACSL